MYKPKLDSVHKFIWKEPFVLVVVLPIPMMVKAHKFVYARKYVGEPKESDFTLESDDLAPIGDNGKRSCYQAAAS